MHMSIPVHEPKVAADVKSPDLMANAVPPLPTSPRLAAILSAKVQGDGAEYTALRTVV